MLNYTIKESKFKDLGYTFSKAYAANYKVYTKKLPDSVDFMSCWVKGKIIEHSQWLDYTEKVINFFDKNYEEWTIANNKLPKPRRAMIAYLDRNTGEILLKDFKEYFGSMTSDKEFDAYCDKYKKYNEIYLFPEIMKITKEEISKLIIS
jgi:hypothetical protein